MIIISISFALLGYCVDSSTPELALILLCCIGGGFGLCISGFLTSLLSIAPNHIGVLSSVIQMVGFGARFFTPILITLFKTTVIKVASYYYFSGYTRRMEKRHVGVHFSVYVICIRFHCLGIW